jgi:hypothetical protein
MDTSGEGWDYEGNAIRWSVPLRAPRCRSSNSVVAFRPDTGLTWPESEWDKGQHDAEIPRCRARLDACAGRGAAGWRRRERERRSRDAGCRCRPGGCGSGGECPRCSSARACGCSGSGHSSQVPRTGKTAVRVGQDRGAAFRALDRQLLARLSRRRRGAAGRRPELAGDAPVAQPQLGAPRARRAAAAVFRRGLAVRGLAGAARRRPVAAARRADADRPCQPSG